MENTARVRDLRRKRAKRKMVKAFTKFIWENLSSVKTPLGATNLNKINNAIDTIDDRVIALDTSKANKTELSDLFSGIAFDEANGVITFTRVNGSSLVLDTKLEKLAVNFSYDASGERLVITLDDGTEQYVDMSALVTIYEFLNSDTIRFTVDADGKVSADIVKGSIKKEHLDPDYLAEILVQVEKAKTSSKASEKSALESKRWAVGDATNYPESVTDNSKYYAEQAKKYSDLAESTVDLNLPKLWIDLDTGCLMADFEKPFSFKIDENGYLLYETVA